MGKWFARASDEGGCVSFYLGLLTLLVPVLTAPAVLFLGWRKTSFAVLGLVVLMIAAPYVFFGIWGLIDGVSVADVWAQVSVTTQPLLVIAGFMVFWSAVVAGIASSVSWGWTRWRTI